MSLLHKKCLVHSETETAFVSEMALVFFTNELRSDQNSVKIRHVSYNWKNQTWWLGPCAFQHSKAIESWELKKSTAKFLKKILLKLNEKMFLSWNEKIIFFLDLFVSYCVLEIFRRKILFCDCNQCWNRIHQRAINSRFEKYLRYWTKERYIKNSDSKKYRRTFLLNKCDFRNRSKFVRKSLSSNPAIATFFQIFAWITEKAQSAVKIFFLQNLYWKLYAKKIFFRWL
jgi:hypothetical protein